MIGLREAKREGEDLLLSTYENHLIYPHLLEG